MKKEIICGVYKITSPTGKIYIGESKNIEYRFRAHKNLKSNKHPRLHNSLKKYGVENHIFEILEECDFEDLKCRERFYQDEFDAIGTNGLNCKLTNCGEIKQVYTQEVKDKMSLSKKGIPLSKETCQRMSESRKGEKSPMARKVIDTITLTIWNCIEDAAIVMGVSRDNLARYLRGERPNRTSCVYLDNYIEGMVVIPITKEKVKTIFDTATGIKYKTLTEAANCNNVSLSVLSRYLTGDLPNKTTLIYLDDYIEGMGVRELDKPNIVTSRIKVIDTSNGIIYNFIKDAAEAVGLSKNTLGRYLAGVNPNKTTMVYYTAYLLAAEKEE